MTEMRQQNPSAVVMVRPVYFGVNKETAADNLFQVAGAPDDRVKAIAEFDQMVSQLREAGITVHIFEQTREDTPDAVFPNNWFSTHHDGTVVLYPMLAPSRRLERRDDLIEAFKVEYHLDRVLDYAGAEMQGQFLEGTGVIVFDHESRVAVMARSNRADEALLSRLCTEIGYQPHVFSTADRQGNPIYHTNVMMGVGKNTALVCFESIPDTDEQHALKTHLEKSDRLVVSLTLDQIEKFAGNCLEIDGEKGPVLVLSARGWASLSETQKNDISVRVNIVAADLPTIEKSGGSARCMMAGVHLPEKES